MSENKQYDEWYDTEQAAEKMNRHVKSIRRLLTNGKIKGYKDRSGVWFISGEEIENFIKGR